MKVVSRPFEGIDHCQTPSPQHVCLKARQPLLLGIGLQSQPGPLRHFLCQCSSRSLGSVMMRGLLLFGVSWSLSDPLCESGQCLRVGCSAGRLFRHRKPVRKNRCDIILPVFEVGWRQLFLAAWRAGQNVPTIFRDFHICLFTRVDTPADMFEKKRLAAALRWQTCPRQADDVCILR